MIKYNIKTVNDWLYNSNPIKGMYYNGRKVYRRFVANGQPTPPTPPVFESKWKATYQDGHVTSAECSGDFDFIDYYEINLQDLVSVEVGNCVGVINRSAFWECSSLSSVTLGDRVNIIYDDAFNGCTSLTSINIPNSVTNIGNNAFSNCGVLPSVTIPDSVTSIGKSAFQGCGNLSSATIGSGVTSIGDNAFNGCSNLASITVNSIVPPALGSNALPMEFQWMWMDKNIYVPSASVETYKSASGWSQYASRIQPIS